MLSDSSIRMNKSNVNKYIKPGQLFKKRDTGIVIEVIGKGKNDKYTTRRVNRNIGKKSSHQIARHDLDKHYEPL